MPVEREVVSVPAADPGLLAHLADQVRSLKSVVALLAILALAALGLALYVLLTDDARDQHGASRARVARLEDRVKRLEADPARASQASDVRRLQARLEGKANKTDLQQLGDNLAKLRTAVAQAGSVNKSVASDIHSCPDGWTSSRRTSASCAASPSSSSPGLLLAGDRRSRASDCR